MPQLPSAKHYIWADASILTVLSYILYHILKFIVFLFSNVMFQPSDDTGGDEEKGGQEPCDDIIPMLWAHLKKADVSNQ